MPGVWAIGGCLNESESTGAFASNGEAQHKQDRFKTEKQWIELK
jgi:hypothetical protein